MNARERSILERLLQVLDDRMTTAGHPYALVMTEHRGTCGPDWCSARCTEYRALFVEAAALLAGQADAAPAQLAPEEVAG